ncbi:MAG: isocitrate lyase/PEP mutase family protein [Alphaproteobacteria bacterium]|nr:isocitrate lyase/PEP mutase family protein [Alphaproteobacteria bacterium]
MHWTPRRERFRALLAGDGCFHPASVFDPISARIAADLGFECGMFAGSTASLAVLGAPDLVVLTLSEFAGQALRINRAAGLPLLVDADHGYGNALNVRRTVEELETAGVAGLTIEDTELPIAFGAKGKARLVPLDEGIGKIRAALSGREDKSLAVIGRTSALGMAGLDEAIRRGRAYEAAGVDALFFTGLKSADELAALSASLRLPLILGGSGSVGDRAALARARVRIALQGHQPFMAAIRAVHDTLKALRDGTAPATLPGLAPKALMDQVTREADYQRWLKDFQSG